jgi:hypothetical protein
VATRRDIYNITQSVIAENLAIATADAILDELEESILDELSETITWSGFETISDLPIGGFWDFVDFASFIILTNGSTIVFIDHTTDPDNPVIATMLSSATFPRCKTYCNFKGQIIGGNVQTTWHDCGTGSIVWSKIGSADFTPDVAMEAGYKVDMGMPGEIHKIKRFGKGFATYGDNGIVYSEPIDWNVAVYKGLPFGFVDVMSVGIPSIKAVNGDDKEHVFVDKLSRVWRWAGQDPPQLLDYREYIEEMTLADVVVSFDPAERDYYISDGDIGYLLTPNGLSQIHQLPTSVFRYNGVKYGLADSDAETGFVLETDTIDFKNRGGKTLVAVEIGGSNGAAIRGRIAWKSNMIGDFTYSPTKLVNPNGVFYPRVTADEFRVRLLSDSAAALQIDYMNLRYNLTDNRSARGRIDVD